MSNQTDLPVALDRTDLGRLSRATPEMLLENPVLARQDPSQTAAARALVFGRSGTSDSYDHIGFRTFAASPKRGEVPLQTSAMMRRARNQKEATLVSDDILQIQGEQQKLRHRPLALSGSGNFKYFVMEDTVNFVETVQTPEGFEDTQTWTFSLFDPPPALMQGVVDDDASLIAAQQMSVDIPGAHWLPFETLIARGRFPRFQDCRDALSTATQPGRVYLFVSHRWLSTETPDPDHHQAAFVAWQLTGYLCEAVRIAQGRGLTVQRKKSALLGHFVGIFGSDLAEALIVNVVRPAMTPETLARLADEIRQHEAIFADYGIGAAIDDPGLTKLRDVLATCPRLAALMDRIYLWYDYSCMPQEPRSKKEDRIFSEALRSLGAFQIMGRTLVLLDDVENYLNRAWCVLEALVADTGMNAIDLLVGSERATVADGKNERHFIELMADRPHFVWRAILDTEVFKTQSVQRCMRRLGLDTTKPEDIYLTYSRIRALQAPLKTHVDDSEIVTGVFPIAGSQQSDTLLIPHNTGRAVGIETESVTYSLNWSDALRVDAQSGDYADAETPSMMALHPADGRNALARSCHVAIVASCEGEACLLSRWVLSHCSELEAKLDLDITSISWLASDIAPVGHFVAGDLRAELVDADAWVVLTLDMRLKHCGVTTALLSGLRAAGQQYATLAVDRPNDNLVVCAPAVPSADEDRWVREAFTSLAPSDARFPRHIGGLFRWALPDYLVQVADGFSDQDAQGTT